VPSKAFSDTTLLYPGIAFPRNRLEAKLGRLRYRKVSQKPAARGEMRSGPSGLEIFVRDLRTPGRAREGFPVKVVFGKNRIESLTRLDTGEPLSLLELEPEELMRFFGAEREERRLVSIDQVPEHVIHAVLAAEDARFFQHPGMDLLGILRALLSNLRRGSIREGGSTITQQLAKNYFLTPERSLSRKLREIPIALLMEASYSKREILEIYLNEIYLGSKGSVSVNGIGEASFFYFGKPVEDLSPAEAATIAGLIKAPNHYSPFVSRERSLGRRNGVLRGMAERGWLSGPDLETALARPMKTAEYETYARRAPYFMDYLAQQLRDLYPAEALTALGLSIHTTLDPEVQEAAEQALRKGIARLEKAHPGLRRREPGKKLQAALVVLQPKTGYVLAMVGGRDYGESQFNRITQARRQPGSAFKPFVFHAALDDFTPADLLSNEDKVYRIGDREWRPENYSEIPEARLSLRMALAKSVNRATADLTERIGVDRIVQTVPSFGFSTPLPPYPSISLGSAEVIPLELARAYCAFAADGVLPEPLSLKEVTDEAGKILDRRHLAVRKATTEQKAFLMSSMLRSVVESGTARSLRGMGVSFPVAGKTGTTNDFRDAWFVGYTPDILALVWVGFDDGAPIRASGSAAALPVFADLLKAIPQHISGEWFQVPPGVVSETVCPLSGGTALPGRCPAPVQEYFLAENRPKGPCPLHGVREAPGFKEQVMEVIKDVKEFFRWR
ncbi:MAG: PBP1A family penicillin-binding protein, partial [Deltaproteobacteria bacterium]|nr:PBP1A family penicillin-binding protein [Deltaproteobacteria bacterium]